MFKPIALLIALLLELGGMLFGHHPGNAAQPFGVSGGGPVGLDSPAQSRSTDVDEA